MKLRSGDLVQILEDPASYAVPDAYVGKIAIIVEFDKHKKIYTVVLLEEPKKLRLLGFMMKLVQKYDKKMNLHKGSTYGVKDHNGGQS